MYKKVSNFTSGGVQDREPKNRRLANIVKSFQNSKPREKQIFPTSSYFLINNALLHHFSANWLVHNKNMTKKSVCREAWSPEMTSQTFPVCSFWSPGFVPHRKWNLTLLVHQNTGKENRYRNFFLLYLSVHWGDLIEQINKNLSYTLKEHKGAIHSTKISGLRFENFLVSNGSRQVRTVSFHSTRKTSFALV